MKWVLLSFGIFDGSIRIMIDQTEKVTKAATDLWSPMMGRMRHLHRTARSYIDERLRQTQIAWIPSLIRPNRAFRFLWAGVLVILLACVVGIVAINTSTGLLYLLVGLLLGIWLVSGLFSMLNLAGISVERTVSGTSQVGEKLVITYTVTNHKRLFRSYSLVLEELGHLPMILPAGYAMSLRPGEQRRVVVEIVCRRRGYMRLRRIRVSSRYPFGLEAKCFVSKEPADVVVHPSLGRVRFDLLSNPTSSASGALGQYNQQTKGFEEFYGLREFQSYDNYHWVHWRSSAKRNQLMVKEMAEYNANQLTVLLDTRVEDPLSLDQQEMLEEAISFAASVIDRATERCLPIALVVSGGDVKIVKHGRGSGHRWALMTELAGVRMGGRGAELPNVGAFRPRSFGEAHCWVVGVGVSKHFGEISSYGSNMTVIDVQSARFKQLFAIAHPPMLAGRHSVSEDNP